jgi:xanthosine utilization system XapX-like protein
MPAFFGFLATALVGLVGSMIGRILVVLGLSVVYYRGLDVALTWFKDTIYAQFDAMPPSVIALIGVLQISTCVNIMFTAMGIKVTLLGLNSEGFKRLVLQ